MEGKETRFGIAGSALFATVTTDASCGAVNSWHDSYTPLGGLVPLFNMQTDEVIFGGVGSGLYGMLLYAILGVFIAGLMVGRTPEYIGKKIQQKEVKMALFAILATSFLILVFSGISIVAPFAKGGYWNPLGPAIANLNNSGPHGLSEMLYAYTSATENNGSAFAGITVNTPWYDLTLGLAMLFGRFLFMIPALAIAGSLAGKKAVPTSAGTLPTHGPLFVGLLVATVIVVGALTFFPALSLGPIVEHFLMHQGKLFSTVFVSFPSGVKRWPPRPPSPPRRLHSRRLPWTSRRSSRRSSSGRDRCSTAEILRRALKDSVVKLNPVTLMKNPVIFVVEVGAALVLLFLVRDVAIGAGRIGFELQIDLWLWFTVLFATFAEAMAEARGKAQAETLRKTRSDTIANRVMEGGRLEQVLVVEAAGRGRRGLQRGRGHPRGRRGHRGDRDGRRVGDHRGERARDPRVRRRSQRRDRRHAGPLRPHHRSRSRRIQARRSSIG